MEVVFIILVFIFNIAKILFIEIILACLLCNIDSLTTYTWYSGIWHGLFFVPNLIRSWFDSSVLYKANFCTTAYNVWWWLTVIWSNLGIIFGGKRKS